MFTQGYIKKIILEKEEGGAERERNKHQMWERNIDRFPPIYALTRDWTLNLLVYGMMLQPTEPPSQSSQRILTSGLPDLLLSLSVVPSFLLFADTSLRLS